MLCLLGKEGLGLLRGILENPCGNYSSHGWARWLSPHQTLPPFCDAVPWDELSTRQRRGVTLGCPHPSEASVSAAAAWLQEKCGVCRGRRGEDW